MNVLIPLVAISLGILVTAGLFLAKGLRNGDYEHADHMAFLPLDDEGRPSSEETDSGAVGKGGEHE